MGGILQKQNIDFRLVTVSEQHRDLFCSLYGDRQTMQYIGTPLNDEQSQKNFQTVLRVSQQVGSHSFYRVIEVTSDLGQVASAGFVRLTRDKISDIEQAARIGSMLLPEYEGRGLAYRAQKKLMSEMHHVAYCRSFTAYCHLDNHRAHRLYRRLAFYQVRQLIYNQQPSIQWQRGIA